MTMMSSFLIFSPHSKLDRAGWSSCLLEPHRGSNLISSCLIHQLQEAAKTGSCVLVPHSSVPQGPTGFQMKRSLNIFVSSHSLDSPKGHDSFQEFGMSGEPASLLNFLSSIVGTLNQPCISQTYP